MEFTVSRNRLLTALQHTRQAISKNNALPMFNDFVMRFSGDNMMTVHASNGQIWIAETILLDAPVVEARSIAVYNYELLRAIKALDEQPLRFVVGEMQMTVYHEIGSFRLPLSNTAEEFLSWKVPCPDTEADDGYTIEYEEPVLKSIINRCSFAMANDQLRPAMNGIFFNLTRDFSDYASSDGHKLVQVRKRPMPVGNKAEEVSFIMPASVVNKLRKLLPKTGDVTVTYQEKPAQCRITIDDNLYLVFSPVDGRYPNYLSVLPTSHEFEMVIDRKQLVKSVDRLTIFAPESCRVIRMEIKANQLLLKTDFEMGGEEQLPCECKKEDGFLIGMQAAYLSQTLKAMTTEKVIFRFKSSNYAVIIMPQHQPDNEELTFLMMPMILND